MKKDREKEKSKTQQSNKETTGHEWDGVKEYDNPDPTWLRILFYITVVFSLVYWILYPSWPVPSGYGLLKWSSVKELINGEKETEQIRSKYQKEFDQASFEQIIQNDNLLKFATAAGRSAFQNNCAVCHGSGAQGAPGYPNLVAGAWIWGGKIDDIYTTLKHGIRANDEESRQSQMAAFGKDKILTSEDIGLLTHYVLSLSEDDNSHQGLSAELYSKASKLFQDNCSACHGVDGGGSREVGAPNLRDKIWLYGNSYDTIYDVIYNGRAGVMPNWSNKLPDSTIRALAIYVNRLGGGE